MKPFRGKRRGPQSPSVGFSSPAARRARLGHPQPESGASASARRRAHFRRTERHDRFVGGQKPPEKVARSLAGGCYSSGRRWPVDGPRKTAKRGRRRPRAIRSSVATCGDCRQCPLTADVRRRRPAGADSGSVANRSVTCPTRLETRTKESNMCASQWVRRNLAAK